MFHIYFRWTDLISDFALSAIQFWQAYISCCLNFPAHTEVEIASLNAYEMNSSTWTANSMLYSDTWRSDHLGSDHPNRSTNVGFPPTSGYLKTE